MSKLSRYISVLKAKGIEPDPLTIAKMLREQVSAGVQTSSKDLINEPTEPIETPDLTQSVKEARMALLNITPPELGKHGGMSDDPNAPISLAQAISGELIAPTAAKMGIKGAMSGLLTAATVPKGVPMGSAVLSSVVGSLTAPVGLLVALNTAIGSGITSETIAANVTSHFGQQAAEEATAVMTGKAALSSISIKGQNAYANAKVAMEQAPKSATQHAISKAKSKTATPMPISTVTPHHTREAISRAFMANEFGRGMGTDPNISAQLAMDEADFALQMSLDESMNTPGLSGGGGNIGLGSGGGSTGIGPGNY